MNGHCSVILVICTAVPSANLQADTGHPVPSQCQPSGVHCSAQCWPVPYHIEATVEAIVGPKTVEKRSKWVTLRSEG